MPQRAQRKIVNMLKTNFRVFGGRFEDKCCCKSCRPFKEDIFVHLEHLSIPNSFRDIGSHTEHLSVANIVAVLVPQSALSFSEGLALLVVDSVQVVSLF